MECSGKGCLKLGGFVVVVVVVVVVVLHKTSRCPGKLELNPRQVYNRPNLITSESIALLSEAKSAPIQRSLLLSKSQTESNAGHER